jgi:hypothetical protein
LHKIVYADKFDNQKMDAKIKHGFHSLKYLSLDLLAIQYKWNGNSIKGIKPGFVYAITNPAWPGYMKIGSTIDVYDRLNTYQTGSPDRDYKLEHFVFVHDRLKFETEIHLKYESKGEWIKTDKVPEEFDRIDNRRRESLTKLIKEDYLSSKASSEEVMSIKSDTKKFLKYFRIAGNSLLPGEDYMKIRNIAEILKEDKHWTKPIIVNGTRKYYNRKLKINAIVYENRVEMKF